MANKPRMGSDPFQKKDPLGWIDGDQAEKAEERSGKYRVHRVIPGNRVRPISRVPRVHPVRPVTRVNTSYPSTQYSR